MATTVSRAAERIFTAAERLRMRQCYGDLASVHNAAIEELDAGQPKNAWALLNEALGLALRQAWQSMSGHANSPLSDRRVLLDKLRSSTRLDKWTYEVVKVAIEKHPKQFTLQQCDLLAAIVRVFAFDKPAEAISIAPVSQPAPTEHREPPQADQSCHGQVASELHCPESAEDGMASAPQVSAPQTDAARPKKYVPTEDEIQAECAAIRNHWTEFEDRARYLVAHSVLPLKELRKSFNLRVGRPEFELSSLCPES